MKVSAFILSVYLILLSAIPCCSFDNCSPENEKQEARHTEGKEPVNNDCGTCSPFFTCTGCTGFTLSFENTDQEIISLPDVQSYAGYILSSIPEVHYDFWQPPRLG